MQYSYIRGSFYSVHDVLNYTNKKEHIEMG